MTKEKPKFNILVVDDETVNLEIMTSLLRSEGFGVATAQDGFKAIAACKVHMPDLILLDLQMPLMSGIDVFKRLRSDEKTRDIPVIFLRRRGEKASELSNPDDEMWVVTKPIVKEELLSRVKTSLRESGLRSEIKQRESELKELSLVDPLTSFRSARYLAEFLKAEIDQCRRYKVPMTLILVEPDQYKDIKRSQGQSAANNLLHQVAQIIEKENDEADIMARLSDSELGLFITHSGVDEAAATAEYIRDAVCQHQFRYAGREMQVSVSIGVSSLLEFMDEDGKSLITYARQAIEQARSAGGNMTLIAE